MRPSQRGSEPSQPIEAELSTTLTGMLQKLPAERRSEMARLAVLQGEAAVIENWNGILAQMDYVDTL